MHDTRRHIKRYLVNPKFQLSFLAYFALFCELNILIMYLTSRLAWNTMVDRAVAAGIASTPETLQFFETSKGALSLIFLVASAESLVILLVGGIILSHRIAGPLYRIQSALKQVAAGKYPAPIKFRKMDYFDEIQDAYNGAMKQLIEHGVPQMPEGE